MSVPENVILKTSAIRRFGNMQKGSSERRMISFLLLGLCLLSLTWATAGVQSSDHLVVFALPRDSITLPCGIPSIRSCSSINWTMAGQFGTVTEVVKAGKVTAPSFDGLSLLRDCSLKIYHPALDNARLYSCDSGSLKSGVLLLVPEIAENPNPQDGRIELQCFLNNYKGLFQCNNTGIHIKWSTEDNTPVTGDRFQIENLSECFSKLIIKKKLTDHHRKWRCHISQNDVVEATISYTTTIADGVEEVFAAVGESVSLSCGSTSSLGVNAIVEWAVGERPPTRDTSPETGQSEGLHINKDSSMFITKVSTLNAGDYQCSNSTDWKKVLNKIRLHTLDVISQCGPGGENLTLTCVLTCTKKCDQDFNLTWFGSSQNGRQTGSVVKNNSLINRLIFPACLTGSEEITCSVQREGAVMASKKWRSVKALQTPAWLALPLGLLTCVAAGVLYVYMKRKRNKDAAHEQSNIGMTHVYEDIQDVNNEELQQQRQSDGEAATITTVYDLVQAVN